MSLSAQLANLESSGLIRLLQVQPELEYLFRHALVQEAAYDSLVKSDRRALHLAAGQAIEHLYPDRQNTRELAHLLARHFYEAGDDDRALRYFTLAGDAAAQVYANAEALQHYSQALRVAVGWPEPAGHSGARPQIERDQLLHLFSQRGRVLELIGRFEEAEDNYLGLEAEARRHGDEHLELEGLVRRTTLLAVPTARMDMAKGLALGEQALLLARRLSDWAAEARSLWNLSNVSKFAGRAAQGVEYGEQSIAVAREHGLREQLALSLNDISPNYWSLGQLGRGAAALEEAQRLLREMGNLPLLADCLTNLAQVSMLKGEIERGMAPLAEALEISRAIANPWGQSFSLWMYGQLYAEQGRIGQAVEAFEECIRLAHEAGFLIAQIVARSMLGQLLGLLGDVEHGLEVARAALARADEALPSYRAPALGALARVHLYRGEVELAAQLNAEAQQFATNVARRELRLFLALFDADVGLARRDFQHVVDSMTEVRVLMEQYEAWVFVPDVLRLTGLGYLGLGQINEARAALEEARQMAARMGLRRVLWLILTALYRVERQSEGADRAEAVRQEARETVEFIAGSLPSPGLRERFLALPDVRDVMGNT